MRAVEGWWSDILALLSQGDGARVSVLLGMPMPEFCEAVRVWRAHNKLQLKAMKGK